MEALKNAAAQAQRVWQQSSRGNQIAIVLLAMASIGAVAGVGIWSSQPQYHPLVDGLTASDAGEVVARLEGSGIAYELNYNGSVVSVPKADLGRARVAIGDKMPGRFADESSSGSSLLETPRDQAERRQRETERRLANTISRSSAIDEARVHISHNETGPFINLDEEPASASVTLTIAQGHSVGRDHADSIAKIIAHGAKNISIESVSVVDAESGRNLREGSGIGDVQLAKQLAYVSRLEQEAEFSAENSLRFLGPDKAIVNVTTDVDFQTQTRTIESIDPGTKVTVSEMIDSESGTGSSPSGRTGVNANTGAGTRAGSGKPFKKEKSESKFDFGKTVEVVEIAPGEIKRMTIAATVDLSESKDQAGQATVTIEDIKEQIKNATGFDETRGDTIHVIDAPLATVEAEPVEASPAGGLDSYTGLLQNLSLGLASILAFVFGFMTLKRFKPIAVPAPTAATVRKEQLVGEISSKAEDDPEAVSRIVAAWLNEPAPGGPTAAAAADTGEEARAAA